MTGAQVGLLRGGLAGVALPAGRGISRQALHKRSFYTSDLRGEFVSLKAEVTRESHSDQPDALYRTPRGAIFRTGLADLTEPAYSAIHNN